MAYSFQTFSLNQVLTAAQMNQVEVNIRDHIHGRASVLKTGISWPRTAKTSGFTPAAADAGELFECSGAFTIDFTAAATLGAGWAATFYNTGSGAVTLDPNGSETIGGAATEFLSKGRGAMVYSDGSNLWPLPLGGANMLHVTNQVPSGTAAGAASGGGWDVRSLNTVRTNEIAGASLAAGQVTLPPGVYDAIGRAGAQTKDSTKLRLWDATSSATTIVGLNGFAESGGAMMVEVQGRFITNSTHLFELHHWGDSSGAWIDTNSTGEDEVYAELIIFKVGGVTV